MEQDQPAQGGATGQPDTQPKSAILDNIRSSLKQKDDTSRFVGLTMLRSFLDSDSELRHDDEVLVSLWKSIAPKFLDRLIKSKGSGEEAAAGAHPTLDLGVSVIHKFTVSLPESAKRDKRLVDRVPVLVAAVLYSSPETTSLIVQTLLELVTFPEGSEAFVAVNDKSPLLEIAPSEPLVFDILERSWLNCMTTRDDKTTLRSAIDETIQNLISSFRGTDGVTLLRFIGDVLRRSHTEALPLQPNWLKSINNFIRGLLSKKPSPEARNSYILAAASLLEVYPVDASRLLFTSEMKDDKPFSYLFITLVLTEIRAMAPRLLSLLNDPSYPESAKRVGSALDIITHFTGHLVRSIDAMMEDDENTATVDDTMPAEYLLKLRTSISETMSLTTEFLRDRWDASVAGAMGLHPDARPGAAEQWMGNLPITWESSKDKIDSDPLILAMLRSLAIWLREDENKLLRKESAGLTDMLLDLYQNSDPSRLDFRSPVLVAFEGTMAEDKGIAAFQANGGWKVLTDDLKEILQVTSATPETEDETRREMEASRGSEIVRVLLPFVEAEDNGTEEDWMILITRLAGWSPPDGPQPAPVQDCHAAVLQLATTLLVNAKPGMRKRYVHSTEAIAEVAKQLEGLAEPADASLKESLRDVVVTLSTLK